MKKPSSPLEVFVWNSSRPLGLTKCTKGWCCPGSKLIYSPQANCFGFNVPSPPPPLPFLLCNPLGSCTKTASANLPGTERGESIKLNQIKEVFAATGKICTKFAFEMVSLHPLLSQLYHLHHYSGLGLSCNVVAQSGTVPRTFPLA